MSCGKVVHFPPLPSSLSLPLQIKESYDCNDFAERLAAGRNVGGELFSRSVADHIFRDGECHEIFLFALRFFLAKER